MSSRNLLRTAAFAGMFVFGIVMALVGAVLTPLSTRLKFEVADIGTLFLAMNCAMLVCSFGVGLVMDRWGTKAPIVVGPLLVGSALALFARANVFNELLPAGVLLGLGGGALNAATNTLIADIHDEASKHSALNVLGVFYGVGALFLPFTIGALMTSLGIVNLLWIAAGLCLVFGLFALPLRFPAPHPGHASVSFLEMLAFLRLPVVIVMAGLLFLQSGSEFTLGGYLTTFLTRDLLVSVTSASWLLAFFWSALMLSRIVLGRALLNANPHTVVALCGIGASAGCAILATAHTPAQASVGLILAAFSYSGIFPTVLGIAGNHFPKQSGTVFGLLIGCALTGGISMPWVAGHAAAAAGTRVVFTIVGASFALIAVLSMVLSRVGRKRSPNAKPLAVLTGGGTLGHVMPNLSLALHLQQRGWTIHYIGSETGPEVEAAQRAGLAYSSIPSGKLRRYFSLKNFIDPLYVLAGIWRAWRILGQLKPEIVFSKGGFVTFPVVLAAWLRNIPAIIHESDLTPGLANRLSFPFAQLICTGFPETVSILGSKRALYTGTPSRPDLAERSRTRGFERFGLDPRKTTILAFGGSLGSRAINEAVRALLEVRPDEWQFVHICGKGNVEQKLVGTPGYVQFEILNEEFPDALAVADVAVCRAGATSLNELAEAHVPAVLIPLPLESSRGDQIENATSYTKRGLGVSLEEKTLTTTALMEAVVKVLSEREVIIERMAGAGSMGSAGQIVALMEKWAGR